MTKYEADVPISPLVYSRMSSNPYWERRRSAAEHGIHPASVAGGMPSARAIVSTLLSAADAERAKELALMSKMAGVTIGDEATEREFLTHFNELLQTKEKYEAAMARMKAAIRSREEKKALTGASNFNNRAPIITSYMSGYIQSSLREKLISFVESNVFLDYSTITDTINKLIADSIDEAMRKMFNETELKVGEEQYGSAADYAGLYDAYMAMKAVGDETYSGFHRMIISQFGLDAITDKISEYLRVNYTKSGKRSNDKKKISRRDKGLPTVKVGEQKARSVGGNIYEYVDVLIKSLVGGLQGGPNVKSVVYAGTGSGEVMKTDSNTIYSFGADVNIDFDGLTRDLLDTLDRPENLEMASRKMDEVYDKHFKNLNESFIVYTSAKAYALGDTFGTRGFGIEKGGNLIRAQSVLLNGNFGNVQQLITATMNLAGGAIFAGNGTVTEDFQKAMAASIAKFMFDDWSQIGIEQTGGAQSIHCLSLDGMLVPLSAFLRRLAVAFDQLDGMDLDQLVHVGVHPTTIKYPDKIKVSGSDADIKRAIERYWKEEAERAMNETTFNIHILRNFNDIVAAGW